MQKNLKKCSSLKQVKHSLKDCFHKVLSWVWMNVPNTKFTTWPTSTKEMVFLFLFYFIRTYYAKKGVMKQIGPEDKWKDINLLNVHWYSSIDTVNVFHEISYVIHLTSVLSICYRKHIIIEKKYVLALC